MESPSLKLEHADSRGEIYSISFGDGQEIMLLHSTPGALRGGHSHDVNEVVVLLSGQMRYHKFLHGEDCPRAYRPGEVSYNPAGEIHMGEFLEDSWLIEYKFDTHRGRWSQEDYEPYRAKVRASAAR